MAAVKSGAAEFVGRAEVRERLGLDEGQLRLALELGEVRCGADGSVDPAEVLRVRSVPGFPEALRERIADVGAVAGAEILGVSAHRFGRLARAGRFRPVRWYVNRYRAVVWRYLAAELREFAAGPPPPTGGVPEGDARARGWRARRAEQLLRDAPGPWERAAVWACLLGDVGRVGDQVPVSAEEAALLARLAPSLRGGGPGWPLRPEVLESVLTARGPDEVAWVAGALATALMRARAAAEPPPRSP
jgi:hypothetical protein